MSKIDYQKLREIAEKTKIAGEAPVMPFDQRINALNDFMKHFSPDIALALLDELERNQQYIKRRDQENEDIALTVGKLRVELEAEKQRAKVLFMENARLKSGIAGLIHLGIRYADVEVMKIAGDAQLSTPCTDSIISSIATGFASKESEMNGQISIVRPGACDDSEIRMIIRLAMGKTITALITPENLALALTGKSDLPVELKLRNVEIKVK
ncbi:ead/Ea22-like family protein [Escherichia coli]|uniref:ead/Ea22-like family protein n=4 Tax=Enterobacterales TaxID=91347 RepID=UPI003D32603A